LRDIDLDSLSPENGTDALFGYDSVTIGLLGKWIDQNLQHKYGETDAGFNIPQDGQRAFALLYDVRSFLKGTF
jgi:hypothetical protein